MMDSSMCTGMGSFHTAFSSIMVCVAYASSSTPAKGSIVHVALVSHGSEEYYPALYQVAARWKVGRLQYVKPGRLVVDTRDAIVRGLYAVPPYYLVYYGI